MQASFDAAVTQTRQRFLDRFETQIEELDDHMAALEEAPNTPDALSASAGIAHKVVGVAAMLGFANLGDLAGKAEHALYAALNDPAPETLLDAFDAMEGMVAEMDALRTASLCRPGAPSA